MNLGHIEIFVKDPLKSKEFYKNVLGFTIEDIQKDKYVWLKKDQTEILLRPGKNHQQIMNYQSTNIGLVLYTNDLDKSVKELTSRGLKFKGTDLSEKCLTFTDPDGNWFSLVNPIDH
ncbi:MAG: VOC family protein [Thermoplasmata archaeon]|nr:MAG: VOC family protein [Thermoplasmata archaeon]